MFVVVFRVVKEKKYAGIGHVTQSPRALFKSLISTKTSKRIDYPRQGKGRYGP